MIINSDGDLVMSAVEVPVTDKRPNIDPKAKIAQGANDVKAGNPLKNSDGPVEE